MEGSAEDLGAPESWEVADLDESMNRLNLLLKDSKPPPRDHTDDSPPPHPPSSASSSGDKVSDDAINQVDQFLREAIQNPRERLSSRFTCIYEMCSQIVCMFTQLVR